MQFCSNTDEANSQPQFFFAEVQYYFQIDIEGSMISFAMVSIYSSPDQRLLELSNGALHIVQYLGELNLQVIQPTQIDSIVRMLPLLLISEEAREYNQLTALLYLNYFFVAEKLGLDILHHNMFLEYDNLENDHNRRDFLE